MVGVDSAQHYQSSVNRSKSRCQPAGYSIERKREVRWLSVFRPLGDETRI
jgi:hypothetical protein